MTIYLIPAIVLIIAGFLYGLRKAQKTSVRGWRDAGMAAIVGVQVLSGIFVFCMFAALVRENEEYIDFAARAVVPCWFLIIFLAALAFSVSLGTYLQKASAPVQEENATPEFEKIGDETKDSEN